MASAIDATKPVAGSPTTQSVRDNFATAKSEITALQAATVGTPVAIGLGGTGSSSAATALTALGALPLVGGTILGSPGSLVIGAPPGGSLGAGTLNTSGVIQINANAASFANLNAGVTLRSQQADAAANVVQLNGCGGNILVLGQSTGGTAAVPAATNGNLMSFATKGHDGAAYTGQQAQIQLRTNTSPWTATDHSTQIQFNTTAVGSTGIVTSATLAQGLVIGAPTGGDKGAGTLNATGVYAAGVLLTSDAQLKTEIAPLPPCLGMVDAIEPKRFRFKDPGPMPSDDPDVGPTPAGPSGWFDRPRWGFVAQDVEAAMSGHDFGGIEKDADGMRSLSHSDLLAVLWQAVREMSAELAELKGKA